MGEIPKKKHPTMIVPCSNCGKLINVKPEHRNYKTHNCSKECKNETMRKMHREKKEKLKETKDEN